MGFVGGLGRGDRFRTLVFLRGVTVTLGYRFLGTRDFLLFCYEVVQTVGVVTGNG